MTSFELSSALICHPPILPGSASVREAHQLICRQMSCPLPANPTTNAEASDGGGARISSHQSMHADSGCVLIVEDEQLHGILTVRDLLRLMATAVDYDSTQLSQVMTTPVLSLQQEEAKDALQTIQLMRRHRIRHLPIVTNQGRLLGLVTLSSLRSQLQQSFFLRFRQVAEVMSHDVVTVRAEASVSEVLEIMSRRKISCVVATKPSDSPGAPDGAAIPLAIITEHDLLQLENLGHNFKTLQIEQLLGDDPICVPPEETLDNVHALMNQHKRSHVLIVNPEGHLAGLATETDLTDTIDPIETYAINQILRKQINNLLLERKTLLSDKRLNLQQAIERNQFRLVYQPLVDLHSGRITGAEALLRLRFEGQHDIPPSTFIPIAEQSDLILELGDWVLETACKQLAIWKQQEIAPPTLSINISANQLEHPEFCQRTLAITERTGINPSFIHLELTETALVNNIESTAATIARLQKHGFKIAVDDFGSGYASLAYIQHFAVDILKLDQSFIRGLDKQTRNQAIVNAVMQLARQLNYQLVVEGVETEEECAFLAAMGFPLEIQGYVVSPAIEVGAWADFSARQASPLLRWVHRSGCASDNTASGASHIASP